MKITVTEAYAAEFLCGKPVLLGHFSALTVYPGESHIVCYPRISMTFPEFPESLPDRVTIERRIYDVELLSKVSEDGRYETTHVVKLATTDRVDGFRRWQAAYYG